MKSPEVYEYCLCLVVVITIEFSAHTVQCVLVTPTTLGSYPDDEISAG